MTSREPRWTGSPRARAAVVGFVVLLGVLLPGGHAWAEKNAPVLYQWTDERGNVRYTPDPDRVPSSQRGTLQRLEPGTPPPSAAPRPAAEPSQAPAPSAVVSPIAPAPSAPPAPAPVPVATPAPVTTPAPVATPAPVPPPAPVAAPVPPPAPPSASAPAAAPAAAAPPVATPSSPPAPAATPDAIPAPGPAPSAAPVEVAAPVPAAAPASAPPSAPAPGDDAREQELAAAIAADEAALKELISAPIVAGDPPLADSAQLREIARRLPELQAELSALRERRAPPAGP